MLPIIATLVQSGLGLIANAAIEKGQAWVEEKTGVKLEVQPTPEQLTQLKQFQLENETELLALQVERDHISADLLRDLNAQAVTNAADINRTMQTEAAAEHWPTYSWRPFIGFVFGGYVASLFLLPMFGKAPVVMGPDMVMAVGAILGIASWHRGKMQSDPAIPTVNRG